MNTFALIPARGGSKGVPGKNIRELNGKPLIAHAIECAKNAKLVDRVIVSTDSEEIAEIAKSYGAEVPFMRPAELASDTAGDFGVIEHAINWLSENSWAPEIMVFLRPTNPFRTGKQVDEMVEKLKSGNNDSIRAISPSPYPPFWMKKIDGEKLVDFIPGPNSEARRQDLPEVYVGNGTVEVVYTKRIQETGKRFGESIGYYKMGEINRQDIDTLYDFSIAEVLYPAWKEMNNE